MKRLMVTMTLFALLIAACQPDQSGNPLSEVTPNPTLTPVTADSDASSPTPAATDEVSSPTATLGTAAAIFTATAEARETSYAITNLTQTASALNNPTPTPTPRPTLTPRPPQSAFGGRYRLTAPPIDLPAPILYQSIAVDSLDGIWLLDGKSDPVLLADTAFLSGFDLSDDRTKVVLEYAEEGAPYWDVWVIDIASQAAFNVSNSPNRVEWSPVWWSGREGFALGAAAQLEESCLGSLRLAYLGLDGSFEILDDEITFATAPSVSPDGSTVAYAGRSGCEEPAQLRLLRETGSPQVIDLAAYGLPDVQRIEGISWSPDGTKLGLVTLFDCPEPDCWGGYPRERIVIVDLINRTTRILWDRQKASTSVDVGSTPVWSASGDWVVFQAAGDYFDGSQYHGERGLWYADANEVRQLTDQTDDQHLHGFPSISPDGEWVITPSDDGILFIRLADGAQFLWEMPEIPYQVAWAAAP